MMDDYSLPSWIYIAVLTVFVGGVMKKILASHLSPTPAVVAWLGATVLVERLWAFCVPAVLVLVLLGVICCLFSITRSMPATLLPAQGKAVFITGCDSGFGKATVKRLDSMGFEVFATVLDLLGDGARELQRTCSSHLTLLQVDITDQQQVHQALLDTKAKLGLKGLWGLVNNAGVCVNFGDTELSLMSNFRGCMEVNFFGTLSVTKNFLPLLRRSRGRIISISSPAGDQPFPCLSAYGASKAALNLLVNTLRHELEPWGVQVSVVLPSSYKTGQTSNHAYWEEKHKQLLQSLPPSLLEEYGEDYVNETKDLFDSFSSEANPDLSPVVNAIVEALLAPQLQPRYFAGPGVGLMYFIHSYCPFSLSNRFLQKLFMKKKLAPRALRKQSSFEVSSNNNNNNNNNNDEKLM
ncbi:corticosteroid 11-beta-dehydrogenase isozyme 2 [Solea senegalensis]|uniref:11-beta-hydroxysteroid dehydrogenase type 2 n=2 Tax=Solea senegalensis TaxID=28829 RepID=A0AAV6Q521_SOLSE|nr:corticosteroid 11-beta-dehydrogenase isozyme 2 [Solea senegalensis]KAG7483160.1 corticosteroid 11-beta-dehydrogenase isozyme 2 [Solea senegalensis]